ncbi:MAG: UDP-N-acetyl-D-mannosamine dehydrogenase [Rhodospirillaceae bacterium]|nr:UDP-N-acetyl-D-mannosamine dehydrogenase [Rhodospirillaceae bacterium]MBT7977373.1 UDP-N-acetyl-D-mannosamine dehydrogenase [Rhodospirillaceae bacterium]
MNTFEKISVVGLGHIGLPTAAVFANKGVKIVGTDKNEAVVDSINAGKPHFYEPNLDVLVRRVVESGKLSASTAVMPADAFLVAVPTPLCGDGHVDLSYVQAAAEAIAPVLEAGNLVILESTSPVGTTEKMAQWMAAIRPDLSFPHQKGEMSDVNIAHCPERLLPGRTIEEVVNNARVIGGMTRKCAQRALSLYRIVVQTECKVTNARTAEMSKLTENAYRDVNIAFANELSVICDRHNINVWELIQMANLHPRVDILSPGPGVGGHCIAVDPWFIVDGAPEDAKIIRMAREINDAMPKVVCNKVAQQAMSLAKPVIACLGLTYKADVDDLRESPAVDVVLELADMAVGELLVVDPLVQQLPQSLAELGLSLTDFDVAVDRANVILLLVDHGAFKSIDRELIKDKIVVDTRGIW